MKWLWHYWVKDNSNNARYEKRIMLPTEDAISAAVKIRDKFLQEYECITALFCEGEVQE